MQGSCDPIKPMEVLEESSLLIFLVTFLPFGLLAIFQLLFFLFPSSALLSGLFGLLHSLWTIGILVANCLFFPTVFPFSPQSAWAGIAFLSFWLLSNLGFSCLLLLLQLRSGHFASLPQKLWLWAVGLLAPLDPSLFFATTQHEEVRKLLGQTRLTGIFFHHLPLGIIQALSLSSSVPEITLVALWLNGLALLLLLSFELAEGLMQARPLAAKEPGGVPPGLDLVSMDPPMQRQGSSDSLPPAQTRHLGTLCLLLFPFLILSLLPQALTLVGLPFCLACLRRFHLASLKEDLKEGEGHLSRLEGRGLFLLPLNLLSLGAILLLLLPLLSLSGLVLLLCYPCLPSHRALGIVTSFRAHSTKLLACLGFALLPLLPTIPELSSPSLGRAEGSLPLWRDLAGYLWGLVFLLALPLTDIITDFQFSFQLLAIQQDPNLEERESLFPWMVLSFTASGLGLLLDLSRRLLEFKVLFSAFSLATLKGLVIHQTPFGDPSKAPHRLHVFHLLIILLEDLPQLLAVCATLSFLGRAGTLWGLKLGLSLLSMSVNLSHIFTRSIFGPLLSRQGKLILQGSFALLFGLALSLLVGFFTHDGFCHLSRTVDSPNKLADLGKCDQISAGHLLLGAQEGLGLSQDLRGTLVGTLLEISHSGVPVDLHLLQPGPLQAQLLGAENPAPVSLTLETFALEQPLRFSSNQGPLQLTFTRLEELRANSSLELVNNTHLGTFLFPAAVLLPGSSLLISGNSGPLALLSLSSLLEVAGHLEVSRNTFSAADLSFLTFLSGTATISANPHLKEVALGAFNTNNGRLEVSGNPSLTRLDLPFLLKGKGSLVISSNEALEEVSLPKMTVGEVALSGNPKLERVDFSKVVTFSGVIRIEDNRALEEVDFSSLEDFKEAVVTISANENLRLLNFTTLLCGSPSEFYLFDNPNLEEVILPYASCMKPFTAVNNPKLTFILLHKEK